jgi:hypothetical protein
VGPRYLPAALSGELHWGIWDRELDSWCSLHDGGVFLPLEWKTKEEVEAWLYLCRMTWRSGLVDSPEGWDGY